MLFNRLEVYVLSYYFLIYGELKSTFLYLYCHVLIEVRLIFTRFFADGRSEHEMLFGEHAAVAI